VIGKEKDKRRGRERSHHSTMLTLQFKNIEPRAVTAFWEKKKSEPRRFSSFMAGIRQGIFEFIGFAPEAPAHDKAPVTVTEQVSPAIIEKEAPAEVAANNEVASKVRSALRNLDYKAAEINKVQFVPDLDFDAMFEMAIKQLNQIRQGGAN
jgi:hypothetical protein